MFASVDQLDFQSATRKSDLISICYMLIFMLNDLDMPLQPKDGKNEIADLFESQIKYKKSITFKKMIKELDQFHGNTLGKQLTAFSEEINQLGFYEKPNYESLINKL